MEQGRIGLTPEAIAPSGIGDVAGDADADGCIPWLFPWTDGAGNATGRYRRSCHRARRTPTQYRPAGPWNLRVEAAATRHQAGSGTDRSHQEGKSGRPGWVATGTPPLAGWRDNGRNQGCALSCRDRAGYRDRLTPVTRTSTHTGPPLIENARSLRRTFYRVNLGKNLAGGN